MNASPAELKRQYTRAKKLLWTEHFREAANTVVPNLFDTADLMAIGSRETNLDPKWLTQAGDHGNAFGLMQADKRSFPEFTRGEGWKDARTGILFGAKVLKQKWDDVQQNAGKRLSVSDRKGNRYTFTGPHVSGLVAQQIAIAGYNSGRWAAYHYTKGRHPDHGTTGKDYSADVMARARVFRELLGKDGMLDSTATPASSEPSEHQTANTTSVTSADQAAVDNPIETPPLPDNAVPVQIVKSEPSAPPETPPDEGVLTKIGNKANAVVTAFSTLFAAIAGWMANMAPVIIISISATVAALGISYMIINAVRADRKEKRDSEDKRIAAERAAAVEAEQKRRDHEIQMALIQSAASKEHNTVVLTPPPVEIPNADSNGGS